MFQTADWTSLTLPILIASVSAFVAFETLAQATYVAKKSSRYFLAALSLGFAIWLTSLYAIQQLQGLQVRFYSVKLITGSLVAAITICWGGIRAICHGPQRSRGRNALLAVLLVCAINAAVLINLSALNLDKRVHWHWIVLLCSSVVTLTVFYAMAVVLSYERPSIARKVFGAVLMGAAINGLDRAAMSSIIMAASCHSSQLPWSVRGFILVRLGLSSMVLLAISLVVFAYERSSRWMRLAHETQRCAQEAAQKTERLATAGKLAACIAHEINNPLEAAGNLLYLVGLSHLDEQARTYLSQAQSELRRVAEIATHTLKFYKQQHAPESVNLTELFETALMLFQTRLEQSNISVERDWGSDVPPLLCRAGELRQVLANLVSNAIDAMPSGGTLRLNLRVHGPDLEVTIADTGCGMSPEIQAQIFEPFFTTKGLRGTGLGLFLSAEIVAKHSGTIEVQSKTEPKHSGTTFRVRLPILKQALAEPNASAQWRTAYV